MAEHIILVAGPMGAGKTTAISALSEIDVLSTEAVNTDLETANKPTTTVALDYGEITLDGVERIRLYGVPGQRRFDFMWRIIEERALGLLLLVNNDAPDPLDQLSEFLTEFDSLWRRGGAVVCVTRSDVAETPTIDEYVERISEQHKDVVAPVFTLDARDEEQMLTALTALLVSIEASVGNHEEAVA